MMTQTAKWFGFITVKGAFMALLALAQTAQAINATGGNSTNLVGSYRIHTFTNSGTFTVIDPCNVDVLVVAGGGGGSGVNGGGGGGAGGTWARSACW